MKKTTIHLIVTLSLLSNAFYSCYSQENKLKIYSTSLGIGPIFSSTDTFGGGLSTCLDLSIAFKTNIFSFYYNTNYDYSDFGIMGAKDREYYQEANLTFGKEFKLIEQLSLEGHIGLGYFQQKYYTHDAYYNYEDKNEHSIGFPLRFKLIYYISRHFGVGINPNLNLNSLNNTLSGNLLLQYKFI